MSKRPDGRVNIPRHIDDMFYRYHMPVLRARIEGRGNGIKTVIENMSDIAVALERPASYPTKFFGFELGAQTLVDEKNDKFVVNGRHDAEELAKLLDVFIDKFLLCGRCHNPETKMDILKNGNISMRCFACGETTAVDMRHKLAAYICKNPPPSTKYDEASKAASKRQNQKAADAAAAASSGGVADDDDDDGGMGALDTAIVVNTASVDGDDLNAAAAAAVASVAAASSDGSLDGLTSGNIAKASSSSGAAGGTAAAGRRKGGGKTALVQDDDADFGTDWDKADFSQSAIEQRRADLLGGKTGNVSADVSGAANGLSGVALNASDGASSATANNSTTGSGNNNDKSVNGGPNGSTSAPSKSDPIDALHTFLTQSPTPKGRAILQHVQQIAMANGWNESNTLSAVYGALFGKGILEHLKTRAPILKLFIHTPSDQKQVLFLTERLCSRDPQAALKIAAVLNGLYEADVLEEDVIFKWHKNPTKKIDPDLGRVLRERTEKFVEWLKTADDDEEEDDEDDEE